MSASSTPRKSTARKAPAKKVAPKTVEARVFQFEEFRDRASTVPRATRKPAAEIKPYVLGRDQGFDPPITVQFPKDLTGRVRVDQLSRQNDIFGLLQVLMGGQFMRVVQTFDQFDDGEELLIGLAYRILDHFYGQGAGDVPGGTPAS